MVQSYAAFNRPFDPDLGMFLSVDPVTQFPESSQLIQMNGRVFDPDLGMFLSVDPVIQFPESSQSLDPYAYIRINRSRAPE